MNPEMKKAQLKELLTNYGPIEFWWMDHAVGTGGLHHEETVEWMHQFQPNTFVGFNHGETAGRISLRELGKPGKIGDAAALPSTTRMESRSTTTTWLPNSPTPSFRRTRAEPCGSIPCPKHDNLCHPAEKIYNDYLGAVKYGNIFSINIGPNYEGRLRDIDVKTLRKVGEMITIHNAARQPDAEVQSDDSSPE